MPDRSDGDNISLTSISSSAASNISPGNTTDPSPLSAPPLAPLPFAENVQLDPVENDTLANEYYPSGDKRNFATTVIEEEPSRNKSVWRKALDIVYPNYILNHLDYNSFKTIFRSWCYLWSAAILTIVPMTSHWLGSAAYLMLIVAMITISGGTSIIMNVLTALAWLIGMMIAFVHHVVRSKIINDMHGGITEQQLVQQLVEEGSCQLGDQLQDCVTEQIFSGRYITTKTVAITILSIITCTMIVGNMRQRLHPLWSLVYIGGQIANVIFSCYGHFSPLYQPLSVGFQVMRPTGISLVLKVLSAFVVFPTTSNRNYLQGSLGILSAVKEINVKNTRLFNTMRPSAPNFANYKQIKKDITGVRSKMAPLEIVASTIWLEYSYGRFDVGDIGQFRSTCKNLITATASYAHFYQLLQERTYFAKDDFGITRRKSNASSLAHGHAKLFSAIQDSYRKVGEYETRKRVRVLRNRIMYHGRGHRISVSDIDLIAKFLNQHFGVLLDVANTGIQDIIEWLRAANEFRIYSWIPGRWQKHCEKQKEMAARVKNSKKEIEQALLKFDDPEVLKNMMFDNAKSEETVLFLVSQGVLFLQIARYQLDKIVAMLDMFIDIDERRPTPKFITFFTKSRYSKPRHLSSDLKETMPEYLQSNIRARNADNLPPSNFAQAIGYYLVKIFYFLLSEELWFWIRAGGLICIGAIPYFVRTTAYWYYSNRFVWLVVMIAVSISESTGQTVYVFVAKLFYTFCGCLLGMVGWYISCGNGSGNYYGYGAVTAVLFVYLAFYRHFSVHQTILPQILFGVTAVLVLGTSWVDANYNHSANVGWGFRPAWLRFVSVIIGLCIGSLTAVVPRPKSSKLIVRKILASSLFEIGNIHCDISKFALQRLDNPDFRIQERHDVLVARFRYLLMHVAGLAKLLMPLKFEIPIAGYWPESKYMRLQMLIMDTVQLYFMLLVALNSLQDPKMWIPIIIKRVGMCYSELDAEIFATIHMASDALKTKDPLPKITEATIAIRHMELLRQQWGINKISLSERFYSEKSENDQASLLDNLDYKKFFSRDGQLNILSLLIAHMIYNRLDEIMMVVKGLVGEVYDLDENILIDSDSEDISEMSELDPGEDEAFFKRHVTVA
ncbi:hypothetical protein PVL30_001195 [Lodderomyces elongisporus]|uniref:uncharacterized protein n=1 Tax=Lodderomyces elongisporus TaxID=36914 RepID=UPI00291DF9EB|nr:uncharacterized protein PVL30_001195 [Lodderomyces elongisporus]WLF77477.1 hypothetical protein PVL30_001195 [Lodderomyces elongisporus]